MATAAATLAGSLISALGNQSRRSGSGRSRPTMESGLPVLAAADKKRLKVLEKELGRERLYNLLAQPEVIGLLITLGGMFAANKIPFSSKKAENEALQAIGVTSAVLLGLGYAGVGDLTTLIIALGAGGLSGISGSGGFGIPDPLAGSSGSSLLNKAFDYSPFGQIYNLLK